MLSLSTILTSLLSYMVSERTRKSSPNSVMFSCVVRGNSTTIAKYKSPEMTRLTPRMARFCQQASCIFDGPLHDKEDGVKVSYLKLWVGDKGLDLFEGFAFAKPEDDLKLKIVLQKFEEYCALRKNANYGCVGIQ